jgi:hypothetical protein
MLEHDRWQHYRPAVCAIAQQYSSATLVSFRFHSPRKNTAPLPNTLFHFFLLFLLAQIWNYLTWKCVSRRLSLYCYTIPSCSSQVGRWLARKCLQQVRNVNCAACESLSCSFAKEKGKKILFYTSLLPKGKNLIVFSLFAVAVILGCLSQLYFVVQNVGVAGDLCPSGE